MFHNVKLIKSDYLKGGRIRYSILYFYNQSIFDVICINSKKKYFMKKKVKNLIFLFITCSTILSCSSENGEDTPQIQTLKSYETQFIGTWQYMETLSSSGQGGTTSFYTSYFTINTDKTAVIGFNEFITATQNDSGFENRTFSATATTYTFTLPNGTKETGNYEFIDVTHVKMYLPGSSTEFNIYTKQNLNANEVKLIGMWQYMVTPHPSGLGGPSSFYKTFFICNADKTAVRGFSEFITSTEQYSDSDNFTWSATATTGTWTFPNGTKETGNYEFIDDTHVKMYQTGSTSFVIYTKQ
jgi:hypothetical protein